MWIEIEKDIFEQADFKGLNFLLQILTWYPTGSIPRYHLFINPERVEHSDNYNNLPEIDKKLIETEFDEAIINGITKGKYLITTKNKNANTFRIEEAILFFNQPVYIIIENSLNDSYFLNAVFLYFDEKIDNKQKLVEFVKNNWIEFVNAGGWTNIRNYTTGKLSSYDNIAAINQKESYNYFRCFVMMDSDKTYPTESMQDKEKLKADLEKQNIKVHILKKRAMENYMPNEVIDTLPTIKKEVKAWVETYKKLNPTQKDYLNYRDGFSKSKTVRPDLDATIQTLYPLAQINDADFNILDEGLKQLSKFKDYFPTFFQSHHQVYKESLLRREGGTVNNNEFLEIIEKINSLL